VFLCDLKKILNTEFYRLLEESSWNFKAALEIFNSDLKEDAIADENFRLK
jgi:TAP C-terminal domain